MDTTVPGLAKALGVSLPAAHRALDKLGVPRGGRGHVRRVPEGALERLIAARGSTPRHDMSRAELRVLAALRRAPLGLPSARSVAAQAGVSPTTASRTLRSLEGCGLVEQVPIEFARGRATRELRWKTVPGIWPESLRSAVRHTRLTRSERTDPTASALPRSLLHVFWNADVAQLSPQSDGSYMAGRLLDAPDIRAWQWALANLSPTDLETAMSRRGVSPRTRALAENWSRRG